ncbi:hypothetical protein COV18_04715 [Candidatus Woesearchaeota archaeon CG10_big_fil_rev_8_21_14_0_10_37_12]|nr:MAG: hypothetical protein COV18_04715 [Candidatus Woesearchaeota archaeon CG10_big_fil_rev_8_21_14_0_10_37_12]
MGYTYLGEGLSTIAIEYGERVVKIGKCGQRDLASCEKVRIAHDRYISNLEQAGVRTLVELCYSSLQGSRNHVVVVERNARSNVLSNILANSYSADCKDYLSELIENLKLVYDRNRRNIVQVGVCSKLSSWCREDGRLVYLDTFPPFIDDGSFGELFSLHYGLPGCFKFVAGIVKASHFDVDKQIGKIIADVSSCDSGLELGYFARQQAMRVFNAKRRSLERLNVQGLQKSSSYKRFKRFIARKLLDNSSFVPDFCKLEERL